MNETHPSSGPFARPALPGVATTMGLSDSRTDHPAVMDSRRTLSWDSPVRASQVPDWSVGARCPQPPRGITMLHLLVASHRVLASPSLKGWPSQTSVTRPNRVHAFALRLTPLLQGASAEGLLPDTAPSATRRTSTYHVQFLSIEKTSQASPGAPEHAQRESESNTIERGPRQMPSTS